MVFDAADFAVCPVASVCWVNPVLSVYSEPNDAEELDDLME